MRLRQPKKGMDLPYALWWSGQQGSLLGARYSQHCLLCSIIIISPRFEHFTTFKILPKLYIFFCQFKRVQCMHMHCMSGICIFWPNLKFILFQSFKRFQLHSNTLILIKLQWTLLQLLRHSFISRMSISWAIRGQSFQLMN